MGCFLGTIHQLMTQPSTNKKDAHPDFEGFQLMGHRVSAK
jgi:hypothetical protein